MFFILFFIVIACSAIDHKRDYLQKQHPDCEVLPNLEIINCPEPTVESTIEHLEKEVKRGHKRNSQ